MKLQKIKHELVVRIPLKQPSYDAGNELIGMTNNLVGVITKDDYTISKLIDLGYKGTQQEGMPIIHLNSEEELRKICKECDIQIIEHETCAYCGQTIYGCHTFGKKGNKCMSCDYKLNK
jgi:hypothetical protein